MKKNFAVITIFLIISSCESGKLKNDNSAINNDSINNQSTTTPTTNYNQLKQTELNHIGDVSLGMSGNAVIEKLNQPDSKSKEEVWEADGWLHQDWAFSSKGIYINMSRENDSSLMEIFSINITHPCTYKTNKNIGIGNTFDEVMAAYKNEIDNTASDENIITVGSLYSGIIFEFKKKKVIKVFLGAAAE